MTLLPIAPDDAAQPPVGVGLSPSEVRSMGALAAIIFRGYRQRGLLVLRAGERWHLRERLAPDALREALLARAAREEAQAQREARSQEERDRAAERAQLRREVLSARTVDEARQIAREHRMQAAADRSTATLIEGDLGLLFGIELDRETTIGG